MGHRQAWVVHKFRPVEESDENGDDKPMISLLIANEKNEKSKDKLSWAGPSSAPTELCYIMSKL